MFIVAIDPSLTATGVAVLETDDGERFDIIEWECIRTKPDSKLKKTDDVVRRVREVSAALKRIYTSYPGLTVVEGQVGASFGGKGSMATMFQLGLGYAAALSLSPTDPIVLIPSVVRKRLVGKGSSTKEELFQAATEFLDSVPEALSTKPAREAVHDAAAVGVAARLEIRRLMAMMPQ